MATINSLSNLAKPTANENVVIENNENNYKMAYKPTLTIRRTMTAQATMNDAITAILDYIRSEYGDIKGYHFQYSASIPDWAGGIDVSFDSEEYSPTLIKWVGIAYSKRYGVYGFTRVDTIGGSVLDPLVVSQLGTGLA